MSRNYKQETVPCGSKTYITTTDTVYEIECTPPPRDSAPPPPDYDISYFAPSKLEYIGVVLPGGDVDLPALMDSSGLYGALDEINEDQTAWVLFATQDLELEF